MGERVAAAHTESRGHVRNADDGESRRKVTLYCLLKTLLFIWRIPKTFMKSDYRLRHVCQSVHSLYMEKLNFHRTDCHEI
jgi:hypothetical protein